MKLVNPYGKYPIIGDDYPIVPTACICNSGAHGILNSFGYGKNCACKCIEDFRDNLNANHEVAYEYSN